VTMTRLFLALGMLAISGSTFAAVVDEIAALEQQKDNSAQYQQKGQVNSSAQHPTSKGDQKNLYKLPNGVTVDISRWQFVTFTRSDCKYCHTFAPVLREVSDELRLPIFIYSFDGQDDSQLGPVAPALPEVVQTFFPELPIATPTTFLVNIDNMVTVPVFQGNTDAANFKARIGMSLQAAYDSGVM
jgi:type-F conjugative transfer system pilin assembly thiol-disulfide isomerase TrbB